MFPVPVTVRVELAVRVACSVLATWFLLMDNPTSKGTGVDVILYRICPESSYRPSPDVSMLTALDWVIVGVEIRTVVPPLFAHRPIPLVAVDAPADGA